MNLEDVNSPPIAEEEELREGGPGIDMLATAHTLLNSNRKSDEEDLLISTFLEVMHQGPKTIDEIVLACNEIWPSSGISIHSVRQALADAQRLGLVMPVVSKDGNEIWTLGEYGVEESRQSQQWLTNATGRLALQISERARNDFGEISDEIAENWALLIRKVFADEIARSAAAYSGKVEQGAAGNIRPIVLDGRAILAAVDRRTHLPEAKREFLKACVVAAVDEADPFGNELLGQVSTSCILHSIAARRGRAAAQELMGTLSGTRIVIDTPILISFLGGVAEERRFSELIHAAIAAEVQVIVPEHVLEELNDLVDRLEEQHLEGLSHAQTTDRQARAYAQLVKEEVLVVFLDGVEAGKYRNWNEFRVRTRGLAGELRALGVNVRAHGNSSGNVREKVDWLETALQEQFLEGGRRRGELAISRDAESMEMVWRARRSAENAGESSSMWPGGWLLSYDSKIGPAYRSINTDDRESLVISPAQLLTLLTEAAPPTQIPELVSAAASFMRQESMLRIATKYPPAIALTLAQTLSQEATSTTDIRVAQLGSLGEILDQTADGQTATGELISSDLGRRRFARLTEASEAQQAFIAQERTSLAETRTQTNAVVAHEKILREKAEKELAELQTQHREAQESAIETRDRDRRKMTVVLLTIGLAATAIVLLAFSLPLFAIAVGLSAVVLLFTGRTWIDDKSAGIGKMFWAILPLIIGITDILKWFQGI